MTKSKLAMKKWSNMIMVLSSIFILGLLITGGAWAQEDYGRSGTYFGLGLTKSQQDFPDLEDNGISLEWEDSTGFDARLGSHINKHLAMEVEFLYNSGFEGEATVFGYGYSAPVIDADVSLWTIFGNLKGYLATGKVQPYGVIGCGLSFAKTDLKASSYGASESESYNDVSIKIGAGIDFYTTNNVAIFFEVAHVIGGTDDLEDMDFSPITLGVMCRY